MRMLLVFLIVSFLDKSDQVEISACYGTIAPNSLTPICSTEEILQVNGLYVLSKLRTSGCPTERHSVSDPESCCDPSPGDCKDEYQGSSEYFSVCVSKETCTKFVAWQRTTCNDSDYLETSSVMLMDYTCIPELEILPITSNQVKSGQSSTIGNPDYPLSDLPPNQNGVCSISSSCASSIRVIALYLELQKDGAGTCRQSLDIEDGGDIYTIGCDDNNPDYKPKELILSRSHFILVRLRNDLTVAGGKLWLDFRSSNSEADIDIKCGTSAVTTPPSVQECDNTATTLPPTTLPPTTDVVTSSTSETPYTVPAQRQTENDSIGVGAIVGIVLCLIVLIVLAMLIALWRYKKKRKGMMNLVSSETNILPDEHFAAALGLTAPIIVPGVAPASSTLGARPPRLTPIETNTGGKPAKPAWGPLE